MKMTVYQWIEEQLSRLGVDFSDITHSTISREELEARMPRVDDFTFRLSYRLLWMWSDKYVFYVRVSNVRNRYQLAMVPRNPTTFATQMEHPS